MRGGGYGLLGDIVVGIIGAFIGGFLLSVLGIGGSAGFVGSIVVAFIGAVILIAMLSALARVARPCSRQDEAIGADTPGTLAVRPFASGRMPSRERDSEGRTMAGRDVEFPANGGRASGYLSAPDSAAVPAWW